MQGQNQEILTGKIDVEKIRNDFPILNRLVNGYPIAYFDNAATTQRPRQVIDAVKNFYESMNANIHRAVHTLSYEATLAYEEAHKKVARFINANSWREIFFQRHNLAALSHVQKLYPSQCFANNQPLHQVQCHQQHLAFQLQTSKATHSMLHLQL